MSKLLGKKSHFAELLSHLGKPRISLKIYLEPSPLFYINSYLSLIYFSLSFPFLCLLSILIGTLKLGSSQNTLTSLFSGKAEKPQPEFLLPPNVLQLFC